MQQAITTQGSKPVGRPTIMTDDILALLCETLQRGFSIRVACRTAGIDEATFYRHVRSDTNFAMRVRSSSTYLYLASIETIYNKIVYEKNEKLAKWYLERTDPVRFGTGKLCNGCMKLRRQHSY
ncbi:hypothetical protein M1328_00740 [Patescibacteria group bacterium]|nr:hypothetical protein [Patescibacteria group bacterium]